MSKITCIIVEDEPLAVNVLKDYIAEVPFLELRGCFRDAILATDFLRGGTVDLIFLDIHLPRLKGMTFLKTLTHPPAVIITTAYHQYAVEGFELNVTDYLLKPIEFERFLVAVNKVKKGGPVPGPAPETRDHLFVSAGRKKLKVLFTEILFIESQREYIRIVTTRKEYFTKMSTNEIEALLPRPQFRRVHRSFIVAVDKIDAYSADTVEVGGTELPVGRAFRDGLGEL